jgi:hypothetical protein
MPRYNRDVRDPPDATLTAASLIDAIITHQINLPNDRQSPAPTSKSDRLFASFQRASQGQANIPQQQLPVPNSSPHLSSMSSNQNMAHVSNEKLDDGRNIHHRTPQSEYLLNAIVKLVSLYCLLTLAWDFLLRWHLGRSY